MGPSGDYNERRSFEGDMTLLSRKALLRIVFVTVYFKTSELSERLTSEKYANSFYFSPFRRDKVRTKHNSDL